jgi:hypothetical protein
MLEPLTAALATNSVGPRSVSRNSRRNDTPAVMPPRRECVDAPLCRARLWKPVLLTRCFVPTSFVVQANVVGDDLPVVIQNLEWGTWERLGKASSSAKRSAAFLSCPFA